MRSSIKKSKIMNIVCIIVVFCLLSYVKFYTAQISFINDPTISIVKTKNIQWISNTHKIDKGDVSYNWYDDYGYKILYADEIGHKWQRIHSFAIALWWIIIFASILLSISLVYKKIRMNKN